MAELTKRSEAPDFQVTIGGTVITQGLSGGLTNLVVEDHVDMVGMLQATFNNSDIKTGSGVKTDDIQIGDEIEVEFGGGSGPAFKGFITNKRHYYQQGTETISVTAMDPTIKLAASRQTHTYNDMTDSDIFEEVVGRAGLSVGKVDATSEQNAYVFQRNESDLNFVKRLASRNGYQVVSNEGKVDFIKPAFGGNTIEIPPDKLVALDYEFTDSKLPSEVTVVGWDYKTKKKVEATAKASDVIKMGGGDGATDKTGQIYQEPAYISDVQVSSQEAAKAMAIGELNRLARNFMRGRATVNGTGEVKAGVSVKFTGQRQNAEVYVISVRHTVESTGLHESQLIFCSNVHPQ